MLRVVAAAAALAIGATVVLAQNAPVIDPRKQTMKALGGAAKRGGTMATGDAPFDLAKSLKRKPREIAERLAADLAQGPGVRRAGRSRTLMRSISPSGAPNL